MLLYILYSKSFDILLHQPRHERPQVTMFQSILKARTAITAYCASKAGNALPSRQPQFWNRKIIETRKSLGRNDCSRNRRRRQNYYTQTELLRLRSFQNLGKKILPKPKTKLSFIFLYCYRSLTFLSLSVGHLTLKSNTLVLFLYLTIPRIRYLMYDTFSVINCGRYKNFGNSWVDCGHGGPKPRSPGIMLRKKQSSAETTIIFQI